MKTSEHINELAAALSKAQGAMENPNKNAKNPFYNSRYADLAEVLNKIRAAFSENGLALIQSARTEFPDAEHCLVTVESRLVHASGQWQESEVSAMLSPEKTKTGEHDPDPQMIGKAITYLRRYAASAVAMLAQEDDDGNATRTPERAPAPAEKAEKPAGPLRAKAPSDKEKRSATALSSELMRLGGTKDLAISILKDVTKGEHASVAAMAPEQIEKAWEALGDHPNFGWKADKEY